jgi:hypothetical protein
MSLLIPPKVYVDESSNSGENLLDPLQPVFSLGAVNLDDGLAAALVDEIRSQLPRGACEPKYSLLARSARGRAALINCFGQIPQGSAQAYVAHKRFMVEAKMVDLLMEPLAHETGYDMYADGAAVGFANLIHFVGPTLGDPIAYETMLTAFVNTVRSNNTATASDLFEAIDSYCQTGTDEWRETVSILSYTRAQADDVIEFIARRTENRDELDPAIPCLTALLWHIGNNIGPFVLIHDNSKVIGRHARKILETDQLPDPTRPGESLPTMPAITIEFSDSNDAPQLQISDWLAGAARQWGTERIISRGDRFVDQLHPFVNQWLIGALWPDSEVIGGPRPRPA